MKDSEEKRIQNQFGGFCTRVLKNEANRIHNGYSRQREWEEPLDHMGPEELSQIAVEDRYFQDDHIFEVLGVPVVVTGDVLAEILAQLPEGKGNAAAIHKVEPLHHRQYSVIAGVLRGCTELQDLFQVL